MIPKVVQVASLAAGLDVPPLRDGALLHSGVMA